LARGENIQFEMRPMRLITLLLGLILILVSIDVDAQRRKKKTKGQNEKEEFELMSKFIDASKQKMLGNFDEAEELYERCVEIDPKNAAAFYELANMKLAKNKTDEAMTLGSKALRMDPNNEWYNLFMADLHNVRYEYDLTEQLFERLIKAHPEKVEYLYELATTQLFQNKLKDAIKTYNQIARFAWVVFNQVPNFFGSFIKVIQLQIEFLLLHAYLFRNP